MCRELARFGIKTRNKCRLFDFHCNRFESLVPVSNAYPQHSRAARIWKCAEHFEFDVESPAE